MTETTQIRKLSLWIFFLPLIAINRLPVIAPNPADDQNKDIQKPDVFLNLELMCDSSVNELIALVIPITNCIKATRKVF